MTTELYTDKQLQTFLKKSRATTARYRKLGQIEYIKVRNSIFYTKEHIEAFLRKNTIVTDQATLFQTNIKKKSESLDNSLQVDLNKSKLREDGEALIRNIKY